MKDREYDALWQEEILPFLKKIEDERNKEWQRYLLLLFGGAGLVLMMFTIEFNLPWWLALLGIAMAALAFYLSHWTDNNFVEEFKHGVFRCLNNIAALEWSVNSLPSAKLNPADLLRESRLYHGYDSIITDDELHADYKSASIDAGEVTAHVELRGEAIRTSFQGFIARVSVDKPFSGETYVQTESDGIIVDSGAGGLFDGKEGIEETELEWGEFERFLVVKSSDPAEARQIFTPDFMAVLYDWWREHEEPLRLSFREEAMYIAFPTEVDLEPRVLGGLEEEKPVIRDILEFMLMLEELTKILVEKQRLRYRS